MSSGLETRPSTRLQRQPQMYSIKRHADKHIGPSPPCRYRSRAPPRRSSWQRASSDTSCPCGPHGWKTAKSPTPSTASCRLRPSPRRVEQVNATTTTESFQAPNFKHRIRSTGQISLAVVADRHHDPKIAAFLRLHGSEFGWTGRIRRIARHAAICRQAQAGRGPIRRGRFLNHRSYPNRCSGGEPSHRYPWRSFKAVCPRRCWRQPGPPIPCTESRARWA